MPIASAVIRFSRDSRQHPSGHSAAYSAIYMTTAKAYPYPSRDAVVIEEG